MTIEDLPQKAETLSTLEAAKRLGLAVRSVQLMVDRGELLAWKTPGGHRRIARASIEQWETGHRGPAGTLPQAPEAGDAAQATHMARAGTAAATAGAAGAVPAATSDTTAQTVLLIEDSVHFQRLVSLLVQDAFPRVALHVASDGITGLTLYGQLQPDVLIVDILLPGIDGPTLITTLRSQPQFAHSRLIVVTSLEDAELAPYAYALGGVPVVHKPRLARELPGLLASALASATRPRPR